MWTPSNEIIYISAARHLLRLPELFDMVRVCSPPALPLRKQQGEDKEEVMQVGGDKLRARKEKHNLHVLFKLDRLDPREDLHVLGVKLWCN